MSAFVSIIVPIYNAQKTIHRCMRSLLVQTYPFIEILLVENNSSDNSYEICLQYAKEYESVKLYQTYSKGASAARNCGIQNAKGEYIVFVDSDDYTKANSIERLVNSFEESKCDLIISDFYYVIGKEAYHNHTGVYGKMSCKDYVNILMQQPQSFYHGVVWNKCYKASIIRENNIRFNETMNVMEDFDFNLHYLKYVNWVYLENAILYWYIYYSNSLSNQSINSTRDLEERYRNTFKVFILYRDLVTLKDSYCCNCDLVNSYILEFYISEKIRLLLGYHVLAFKERVKLIKKLKSDPILKSSKKQMTGCYRFWFTLKHTILITVKYIRNQLAKTIKIVEGRRE